jgi:tRNA(fMet)-specific endonuclease VapC
MKLLCDTNAVTALRLGNDVVIEALEEADTVLLSVVVLGEMLFGYAKGTKERENLAFLKTFLANPAVKVLHLDEDSARVYARLRLVLHKSGKPIPTNDLWIAAQAMAHGAAVLSSDAHFDNIAGLYTVRF